MVFVIVDTVVNFYIMSVDYFDYCYITTYLLFDKKKMIRTH